jgi:hypothetical protein
MLEADTECNKDISGNSCIIMALNWHAAMAQR